MHFVKGTTTSTRRRSHFVYSTVNHTAPIFKMGFSLTELLRQKRMPFFRACNVEKFSAMQIKVGCYTQNPSGSVGVSGSNPLCSTQDLQKCKSFSCLQRFSAGFGCKRIHVCKRCKGFDHYFDHNANEITGTFLYSSWPRLSFPLWSGRIIG